MKQNIFRKVSRFVPVLVAAVAVTLADDLGVLGVGALDDHAGVDGALQDLAGLVLVIWRAMPFSM